MELCLVLHNIRSVHNVGSIFRTADGAGVDKIYLTGYTPVPPHYVGVTGQAPILRGDSRMAKTALGAEKSVAWEVYKQPGPLLKKLKQSGRQIVALEQSANSVELHNFRTGAGSLVLVLGNEVRGLSAAILKYCDAVVVIPMRGKKESLNVAVAAGVALYEITQRD